MLETLVSVGEPEVALAVKVTIELGSLYAEEMVEEAGNGISDESRTFDADEEDAIQNIEHHNY